MRIVDIPNHKLVRALVRAPVIVKASQRRNRMVVVVSILNQKKKQSEMPLLLIWLSMAGDITRVFDIGQCRTKTPITEYDLYCMLREQHHDHNYIDGNIRHG